MPIEDDKNESPSGRSVTVRFVDAGTGDVISRSRVAVADLPPVILPHQTIILSDTSWRIAKAEPPAIIDAKETLTLLIQDPEPQALIDEPFMVPYPTRADSVPPLAFGTTKAGKRVLEINEEDWRQTEFVAATQRPAVEDCLDNVRSTIATSRVKWGYKRAFVRTELPDPLYGLNVPVAEVESLFGEEAAPYEGICFERFAGLISGGFGLATDTGIKLYGQQQDGIVKALCLGETYPIGDYREHVDALTKFADVHGLALVDWLQTLYISPTEAEYRRYFG